MFQDAATQSWGVTLLFGLVSQCTECILFWPFPKCQTEQIRNALRMLQRKWRRCKLNSFLVWVLFCEVVVHSRTEGCTCTKQLLKGVKYSWLFSSDCLRSQWNETRDSFFFLQYYNVNSNVPDWKKIKRYVVQRFGSVYQLLIVRCASHSKMNVSL